MNLESRIEKLEQAAGASGACPECRHIKGGQVTFTLTAGEVFDEHTPFRPSPPKEPERCGSCGRITVFTFTIFPAGGYDDDAAGMTL